MKRTVAYKIGGDNEFIIENYNYSKAFSSFLPGIAGVDGIPMWTFYVNRNQAVCSFGIENKDRSMMEFLPANFAYQLVGSEGFRTFIKLSAKKDAVLYEPFRIYEDRERYIPVQTMAITPYSVVLKEENAALGLNVEVKYCNAVNEPFAGLIRQISIKNISRKTVKFELLDGMPLVVPFGMDDFGLKKMRYLVKSFGYIENLDRKIPFFHILTTHEDRPDVAVVKRGHYYACYKVKGKKIELKRPLVDASQIFGMRKDFIVPSEFNKKSKFSYDTKEEIRSGEFASAMCHETVSLKPSESATLCCVSGTVDSLEETSKVMRALSADFADKQFERNKALIGSLMANSLVISGHERFDRYSGQNFLDNVLRGGFPIEISKGKVLGEGKVLYVYSRKHGDLERDYNQFQISPTPYSQGDTNYRDVCQNRRNDLFFNPDAGMTNIVNFMSLLQLDGFNPHIIEATTFRYKGDGKTLREIFGDSVDKVKEFLKKPFAPGDLLKFLDSNSIRYAGSRRDLLSRLMDDSESVLNSRHGEGFWSDHSFYNLDLIDSFLAIFPDRRKELFFGRDDLTFRDNSYGVAPREDKHVLWDGKPIQVGAVRFDKEKEMMISERGSDKNCVRKADGKGDIYRTKLITKLLILAVNKINSIGPDGCGIEMEADKPNWNDSLNGLPALFGSSSNETFELKRLIDMISSNLDGNALEVPEEVAEMMEKSRPVLSGYVDGKIDEYGAWDNLTQIKEDFRSKTRFGISGKFQTVSAEGLSAYLGLSAKRVQAAIEKAFDKKTGLYHGYFVNVPAEYETITRKDDKEDKGLPCIKVKRFDSRPLPLFLEAQVHALRLIKDRSAAKELHGNLMKSALVDRKLKMFLVSASVKKEPYEIGRITTFSPGWLENQSVWLHMEYKYMLELLKAGLYDDFYKKMKEVLIPFLKPEIYGRSIFENCSFIASSLHPDKKVHGNGFYARLSGSTAEFVHMWLIMVTGGKPFALDDNGKLVFSLSPALKGDMFLKKDRKVSYYSPCEKLQSETVKKGTLKFIFLGKIPVTYINPKRKDIFGGGKEAKYLLTLESGDVKEFIGLIPEPYAVLIRERRVKEIKLYFS